MQQEHVECNNSPSTGMAASTRERGMLLLGSRVMVDLSYLMQIG